MILNISIKNFRSFKEEVTFSMVAESSKSKDQNVFVQSLAKGEDEVRLLNTALIYGSNASGKSNLLRAVFDIIKFVTKNESSAGEKIVEYDPFLFDESTINKAVEFFIEFVGKDNTKYKYELHFLATEIIKEELLYWPNNKPVLLITRISSSDKESLIHNGQLGPSLGSNKTEIFKNQTFLSKFGKDLPNDVISKVFIYLHEIRIINACNTAMINKAKNDVNSIFVENSEFREKVNSLIKFSDVGLEEIRIKKTEKDEFTFPEGFSEEEKNKIINRNLFLMYGMHKYKENTPFTAFQSLPFSEESGGTRSLYALGGKMLEVIENGGILFVDELETSFHPYLSKLLICLFQNKRINKKNAQLIFTTHDTNLLDRTLFRKDQIWFVDKDEWGATEFYSLQDFNEVREDTAFDKWYLAGKFGGIPNIKSLESLFVEK